MYQEHTLTATAPAPQTGYWLKLGDAAHALGLSEITLRRKVKGGKLAHDFRGGKYYVYLFRDSATGQFYEPDDSDSPPSPRYERTPVITATREGALPSVSIRGNRSTPVPTAVEPAPLDQTDLREIIVQLQVSLTEQTLEMQNLRRTAEDQQTLIAFLEETLENIQIGCERAVLAHSLSAVSAVSSVS
jgi:hypothetical protein